VSRLYRSQIVLHVRCSDGAECVQFCDNSREARFWVCVARLMGDKVVAVGHRRWV